LWYAGGAGRHRHKRTPSPPSRHSLSLLVYLSSLGRRSLTGHVIDVSPTARFKNTISSAGKITRASTTEMMRTVGHFGAICPPAFQPVVESAVADPPIRWQRTGGGNP